MVWVAVADVVLSVHVTVPDVEPVVIGAVACTSVKTVTVPHETPATPVGVKVGAPLNHVVPLPINVVVVVCESGMRKGVRERAAIGT